MQESKNYHLIGRELVLEDMLKPTRMHQLLVNEFVRRFRSKTGVRAE